MRSFWSSIRGSGLKFIARFRARKGQCLFTDMVSGKRVYVYRWRGMEWCGDGRIGMWMERSSGRKP